MSWSSAALTNALHELAARRSKDELHALLHRFVVETNKQDEFLGWLAKDMGLDKPMDLTELDALLDRLPVPGQRTA